MLASKTKPMTSSAYCVVDGQPINIDTVNSAVDAVISYAKRGSGFTFFTLNLDHLCKLKKSVAFRSSYTRADFVSADGAPVVWLAKMANARLKRTTGADLVRPVVAAAARAGISIFLFGSTPETLAVAADRLKAENPGLIIAGCESPAMGFEPSSAAAVAAADRIAASGAGLCFVALGAPKQEIFADMLHSRHGNVGMLCIGAALDFIAGKQSRAPGWIANHAWSGPGGWQRIRAGWACATPRT